MSAAAKAKLGSGRLAQIGKSVRKRLIRHDRVEAVGSGVLDLYIVQGFLLEQECTDLMHLIDETSRPSTLYEGTEIPGFRTSYSGDLNPFHPLVQIIEGRICNLMGLEGHDHGTLHRDGEGPGAGAAEPEHHLSFSPGGGKQL